MSPAAAKKDDKLNLSSEESLSADSDDEFVAEGANEGDMTATSATINVPGLQLQERDPVPEGFIRKPELYHHSNPRLTLVFLTYERPVTDVRKLPTLINVSHIAHKFS